jgi:hypothetical protein
VDLVKSFFKTYKNFIQAISEKELEYLEKNCERKFGDSLIETLEEEKDELHLNQIDPSEIRISIEKIVMSINFGLSLNRDLNKNLVKSEDRSKRLAFFLKLVPKDLLDINYYEKEDGNIMTDHSVVRFLIDYKTNYVISKEKISDPTLFEEHNLILESEIKNNLL